MVETMMLTMFVAGLIIAIGGFACFIYTLLARRKDGGGLTLQIGKHFTMRIEIASLAFTVVGVFMALSGYTSATELEERQQLATEGSQTAARLKSFGGNILRTAIELTTPANGSQGEPDREGATAVSTLQDRLFDHLARSTEDKDFALSLLQAMATDSFGRIQIPENRVDDLSLILAQIVEASPTNALLLVEASDAYRSLYSRTRDEKHLNEWGSTSQRAIEAATTDEARFSAHQLMGLYHQEIGNHSEAEAHLQAAARIAPPSERHKVEFNLCNTYLAMDDWERASEYCRLAVRTAEVRGIEFWQPLYVLGLTALRRDQDPIAAAYFIEAAEISNRAGELELMKRYLATVPAAPRLCSQTDYRRTFAQICEAAP